MPKVIKKEQKQLIEFYEKLQREISSTKSNITRLEGRIIELNNSSNYREDFSICLDGHRGNGDYISVRNKNHIIRVINLLISLHQDDLKILEEQFNDFVLE